MSILCKSLKDYCVQKMSDREVINYIPFHYVVPVQERAEEKGIEIPTDKKIRNVRHKKQFDKEIVDIFVELADENKRALKKMTRLMDGHDKMTMILDLVKDMGDVSEELLKFDVLEYEHPELKVMAEEVTQMSAKLKIMAADYKKTIAA